MLEYDSRIESHTRGLGVRKVPKSIISVAPTTIVKKLYSVRFQQHWFNISIVRSFIPKLIFTTTSAASKNTTRIKGGQKLLLNIQLTLYNLNP